MRSRFLTRIDPAKIRDLGELNLLFWQWLEEDYQRKRHSALNMSPLDFFMSQANKVTIFSNPAVLEELLLLRIKRKVNHDATLSVDSILFETDQCLANSHLEVRYDPEWLISPTIPLLLYKDGLKVGEARQVNFQDNSHVKRKGKGRPPKAETLTLDNTQPGLVTSGSAPSLSFANLMDSHNGEKEGGT